MQRADSIPAEDRWRVHGARVEQAWASVTTEPVDSVGDLDIHVGEVVRVCTTIGLAGLFPEDVSVELYLGRLSAHDEILDSAAFPMNVASSAPAGTYVFEAEDVTCKYSIRVGYTVRVLPFHTDKAGSFLPGIIHWARSSG